jgi:hypothetical protein
MFVKKLGTIVFAAAALLCMQSGDADAATRSCNATYELVPAVGAYETIKTPAFSATGECGWGVWDRCRRRARDAASACMTKHNENFSSDNTPDACNESTSNVNNYSIRNLEIFLKQTICESYANPASPIKVTVNTLVTGDSGCGSHTKLRDINLQCATP